MSFVRTVEEDDRIDWVAAIPFWGVHVLAIVGIWRLGFSWKGLAIAVFFYYLRMFGTTAGYHRYFAHKAYKTSRAFQFFLAVLAQSSTQKGVLWWAAHHRNHHKYSDKPEDIHSMKLRGFIWSHFGWILMHKYDATEWQEIQDFAKYPELRWLNRFHVVPTIVLATTLYIFGGWTWLVWGYFVSTSVLWHGTFSINSLAHWLGRRRYATTDESRNSLFLALITMGEGWHNNHHYYPKSTSQGFYWWEIDMTYYILRALASVGLVWDLETIPKKIRDRRMVRRTRAPEVSAIGSPIDAEPISAAAQLDPAE
jgi:stearoyl-CoA desaturase (delta-9 desaturase)